MALIKSKDAQSVRDEAVILDLGDLHRQAQSLRERARAEANQIVNNARQRAGCLVEKAESDAARSGYERGVEEGRATGRAEALEQMSQSLEQLQAAWVQAARQWDSDRTRMVQEARRSLLELSLALARRIVHRTARIDPDVVIDQVAEAISHVAHPHDVVVRIAPEDRSRVEQALPRIVEQLNGAEHISLEEDASIEPGGCIVLSGRGRIDATLERQLDRIVATLLPDTAGAPLEVVEA